MFKLFSFYGCFSAYLNHAVNINPNSAIGLFTQTVKNKIDNMGPHNAESTAGLYSGFTKKHGWCFTCVTAVV